MNDYNFPFKLGDYIVFDRIGRGGMAEIFLATRSGSCMGSKKVILKKIHAYLAKIPSFVRALMNEAGYMDRIKSPFVTKIIDLKSEGENTFIAMEYVEGLDLNRLLGLFSKHKIPVPVAFAFHVISCVLEGLHAVHETKNKEGNHLDLIHLDLSPGNVLISFSGEVKICDFGVATTSELTRIMSRDGEIRGKLSYMSPEQASGEPLDRRSDLFSAGIIFWELLSGRKLYTSKDKNKIHEMAMEGSRPPLESGRFPDQEKLEAVLSKALDRDRENRYRTALEFLDDVTDYIHKRKLVVNQISLGEALEKHFFEEILQVRYERERALSALLPSES